MLRQNFFTIYKTGERKFSKQWLFGYSRETAYTQVVNPFPEKGNLECSFQINECREMVLQGSFYLQIGALMSGALGK